VVLLCWLVAAATGVLLIAGLPLSAGVRSLAVIVWLLLCRRDLERQRTAYARVRMLRIDALGRLSVSGANGDLEPATLLPGCVVLARAAWLNIRFADGKSYGELLCGGAAADNDWHRLQLIWELRRSAFGGTE
jgi:hypothetical protein